MEEMKTTAGSSEEAKRRQNLEAARDEIRAVLAKHEAFLNVTFGDYRIVIVDGSDIDIEVDVE